MLLDNVRYFAEIGLNHLGSEQELNRILNSLPKTITAVTLQLRESNFYKKNPNLALEESIVLDFVKKCREREIIIGLAISALEPEQLSYVLGLEPDFIKLLSACVTDESFLETYFSKFPPKTFIANGKWEDQSEPPITELIRPGDAIIHTYLSHDLAGQNIQAIRTLRSKGYKVGFGLHSANIELASALAVGAGADFVFFYIGDRKKDLPDSIHAIDLQKIEGYVETLEDCYRGMTGSKSARLIEFVG